MNLTEKAQSRIPVAMLESAREMWPETKDMSTGQLVRFAFAIAVTGDREKALHATIDRRITRHQENVRS